MPRAQERLMYINVQLPQARDAQEQHNYDCSSVGLCPALEL